MFKRKFSLFNKLILGLIACIIALVFLLYISYQTSEKLYKSFGWVEHSYKIQAQLETLVLLLTKQESDTRRFIITSDERSLWEIEETSKDINSQLTNLNFLIKDNPGQVQSSYNLRRLFQKKLSYLYQSVNLKKSRKYKEEDIIQLVQEGSTYKSQIMLLKNMMEMEEENLLKARQKEVYMHMVNSNISIYLAGVTSIGCIILILFIIYKERLKQLKIEHELKQLDANKNKFFSIISHDLRGPANGIVKLTGFLRDESISKEDATQVVSLIENSSIKLVALLESLLTWARLQMTNNEFKLEPVNLLEVTQQAIESLKVNANLKEIQIDNLMDGTIIMADRNMILTAIRNIISNSIKFTHPHGKIEVSIEKIRKQIYVYIKDNGVGMSEDVKNNLFKIGKSSSLNGTQNETGTGLGLLLCKEFIEKNKGTISVESKTNEGCKFILSFPAMAS